MKKCLANHKIKVALVTLVSSASLNGLSNYIVHLFNAIRDSNKKIDIHLITNGEFYNQFKDQLTSNSIEIIKIPHYPRWIMRPVYFIWQNLFSTSWFSKRGFDIIHLPNAIPIIRKSTIPIITTIHDVAEFRGFRHTGLHNRFRKWVLEKCVGNSDSIITVSNSSYDEICNFLNVKESNLKVVYPGLPLSISNNTVPLNNQIKKQFIYFSSLATNKNTQRVLQAFKMFNSDERYILRIIGKIPNKIRLQEYSSKIIVMNNLSNDKLIEQYLSSIALIYPSLYEGFGFPVLEALSLGVPVITSRVTSMPEVAADAAIYIDPEDVSSIANAMNEIAQNTDLRSQLIAKGFERSKLFNWTTAAKETTKIYKKTVK